MSEAEKMLMRENAIRTLLSTIDGEDVKRQGLMETPSRVAKMYEEIFSGYGKDSKELFVKAFKTDNSQMVIIKDIDYFSQCEHHMVPFFGKVHIGYIPRKSVLGLSKFARLVEIYARRLQIQEQMTFQIAEDIDKYLNPLGVAVVVTGQHLCMGSRGVKKANAVTITNELRGIFLDEPIVRQEFFSSIHNTLH